MTPFALRLSSDEQIAITLYLAVQDMYHYLSTCASLYHASDRHKIWKSLVIRDILPIQDFKLDLTWIDLTMEIFEFTSYQNLYKAFYEFNFPLCSYYSCIAEGIFLPKGILLCIQYDVEHKSCNGYFYSGVIEKFQILYNSSSNDIYPTNRFYTDKGPGYLNRFFLSPTKYADHLQFTSYWKKLMQFIHVRYYPTLSTLNFYHLDYNYQYLSGLFIGDYGYPNGNEIVLISFHNQGTNQQYASLQGMKITGDVFVPANKISFDMDLNSNFRFVNINPFACCDLLSSELGTTVDVLQSRLSKALFICTGKGCVSTPHRWMPEWVPAVMVVNPVSPEGERRPIFSVLFYGTWIDYYPFYI